MEIDGYWIWIFEMMAEENKRVKSKLYQLDIIAGPYTLHLNPIRTRKTHEIFKK
jgi:hypothetical protein